MADAGNRPIIVKKVKKGGHGHHGGAWKVAYADFVTAMMAFFLLLWLLNATTKEQKNGIADYFSPTLIVTDGKGGGQGVMGGVTISVEGSLSESRSTPGIAASLPSNDKETMVRDPTDEEVERKAAEREQAEFEQAKDTLRQAMEQTPELKEFANHIVIESTPEGLRIQIVDQERRSMFPSGSADMHTHTQVLMQKVAQAIARLPNRLSVSGHTDAVRFRSTTGYSNWELSSDRALATRRALVQSGIPAERIAQVVGKADTEPMIAEAPADARNRRITIVLLREHNAKPKDLGAAQPPSPAARPTRG